MTEKLFTGTLNKKKKKQKKKKTSWHFLFRSFVCPLSFLPFFRIFLSNRRCIATGAQRPTTRVELPSRTLYICPGLPPPHRRRCPNSLRSARLESLLSAVSTKENVPTWLKNCLLGRKASTQTKENRLVGNQKSWVFS